MMTLIRIWMRLVRQKSETQYVELFMVVCLLGLLVKSMNHSRCEQYKDSLYFFFSSCKSVQFKSFNNLIWQSIQIKYGSIHGKHFGILDFFGFEINKSNHFEQLVNNYCSEKLHQVIDLPFSNKKGDNFQFKLYCFR